GNRAHDNLLTLWRKQPGRRGFLPQLRPSFIGRLPPLRRGRHPQRQLLRQLRFPSQPTRLDGNYELRITNDE
ncbi:MAG TPA: hypothetical protein PLC06_16795, partial [Promineifilum sp.]|nr:hypothetical protein [Promineifilum sp.]